MSAAPDTLARLRDAVDGDKARLCAALGLRADGRRYFCPMCQSDGAPHADGDFSIESGFKCHRCGWSGDGLALVQSVRGCDFPAALAWARDLYGIPLDANPTTARKAAWKSIEDAAAAFPALSGKLAGATVAKIFQCFDADGKTPRGAEVRYRMPGGGKECRPFKCEAGKWLSGAPATWTLYCLREVPTTGPLHIPEGPKCCDMMRGVGMPAVASFGGASGARKTDWSAIRDRDVFIFPDADPPGMRYALDVAARLTKHDCRCRIVELPGMGEGGDVADLIGARRASGVADVAIRDEVRALADAAPVWTAAAQPDTTPAADGNPIQCAAAGAPYAMTDLGNAERLAALHGDKVRWDVARKCWRVWDGRRWAADNALKVHALAADTVRNIRKEAAAAPAPTETRDLGRDLFAWAVKSESRERLAALLDVARARPGIAVGADEWDRDPMLLNVRNGTLDLHDGKLRQHDPADLLTNLAAVEYDPDRRCERWERFLHDATGGDVEAIEFLQVAAGYTLTGDASEEKLYIVHGPEASGKTTWLESLRAVLGDYARTVASDLLTRQRESSGGNANPELASLAGVRLAAASEMEQGREIAEALAKNVTGGETVTARHLYAAPFEFRPQFKLWLALNHCPRVSADDGAIWRRILRIGFEHTVAPERRDKTLKPYLRNPAGGAPAVLAWAVRGCLLWQKNGLQVPAAVERSTAAYRVESDPLAAFVEDALAFHPAAWTPWADIWAAYCHHADEQGTRERFRVAPKRLQEKLKAAGCESDRRHTGRGWSGVELKPGWRDACDACDATSKTFPSNAFEKNFENRRHDRHDRHAADENTAKIRENGQSQIGLELALDDEATEERAAILEFDAGLPRDEAERLARLEAAR